MDDIVAGVRNTTSETYVNQRYAKAQLFDSVEEAIEALKDKKVKAVIFDQPTLQFHESHVVGGGKIEVLDLLFQKEKYTFETWNL